MAVLAAFAVRAAEINACAVTEQGQGVCIKQSKRPL